MLIEIPRFNQIEYADIYKIFSEKDVPFETQPVQLNVSKSGGYHEYNFCVSKENFPMAIELIKEYLGLVKHKKILISGKCPACGYDVVKQPECPDCGLSFNPESAAVLNDHPFYIFLKQNGLY